jgi:hypothetical protein
MRLSDFLNDILRETGLSVEVHDNDRELDSPADLQKDPNIEDLIRNAVKEACKKKGLSEQKAKIFAEFVSEKVTGRGGEPKHDEVALRYEESVEEAERRPTGETFVGRPLCEFGSWEEINRNIHVFRRGFKSAFDHLLNC